ncbi:HCL231Wp [Eremothecium sinecaudum]|uniref:HCL231Wp n=1 Tax=Eremothecium sinecaudum TaxID=45286 RepID=A0A120K1Z3_9SACH|nr:HCL231Wp [Eremothecium sinecaudum]AMD19920.1 HCL231Wp [Eremothecium sinecaudum]
MGGLKTYQFVTVAVVGLFGVYSGVKFFEPLVINQLKVDGNLRNDIEIPEYDSEGNLVEPSEVRRIKEQMNMSGDASFSGSK